MTSQEETEVTEELVPSDSFVPYFSDPDRAAHFRAIGKTWEGTPFAAHSRAKGPRGGIDCVGFIEEWFLEAEAAPRFHFPRSDSDYKSHRHNDKILQFLRGEYLAAGEDSRLVIDHQSALLFSLFAELTNLDELVPIVAWPARPLTGLMTGDILVLKSKIPGVWHLPAMLDDRTFLHCAAPLGVTRADITQADYREQLRAVFRLRAVPLPALNSQPSTFNLS